MRVAVALLADAANVSREGKLNILGIFDTIYARAFPTTHAQMHLVLRLEAEAGEAGSARQVEVRVVAPDGRVAVRLPGAVTVPRHEAGEVARIDRLVPLTAVAFDGPGRWAVQVTIDGVVGAAVPLRVEELGPTH
jgi:hypothetical protein